MAEFPLDMLDKILGFRGGSLDLILFYYLKRAMRALNIEFGLSLLFGKNGKLISMTKAGEFSEGQKIEEMAKGRSGILPIILKGMKPYLSNDLEKDPFHLSFRHEEVGSVLGYPFNIIDERKAVVILLSKRKNHFEEKHMKEIKRIVEEMVYLIEKKEVKRAIALYKCSKFQNTLKELLGKDFELIHLKKIEDLLSLIKDFQIEFIIKECEFSCSKECNNIFSFSRETFIPVGILRSFSLKHKISPLFSFSIYSPLTLSPVQESIRNWIIESRYYITSEKCLFENIPSLNIAFVQKYIVENSHGNLKGISKHFNLSPSHLSRTFKSITGISLKEFKDKIKMCNFLFQLIDGEPIERLALLSGYCDRFSFCRAFKRIFGIPPSLVKKE